MSNTILALDVSSSSTGYSVIKGGRWRKESENLYGVIKTKSKDTLGERLSQFRQEIVDILKLVKPTHVIIEDVFCGRNVKTLKLLARFNGVAVESVRTICKVEPVIVMPSTVRAFLKCGRKKEECFAYIVNRYSLDWKFSKMNDVADSIALGLYLHGSLKKAKGKL